MAQQQPDNYYLNQLYRYQAGRLEDIKRTALAMAIQVAFRGVGSLNFGFDLQRKAFDQITSKLRPVSGVRISQRRLGDTPVEWVQSLHCDPKGVIIYLHGGVFCLGSAKSHRSITSRLARMTGASVAVVDYSLAPENPYPKAIDEILAVHQDLRRMGYLARQIAVAGDSAGGMLSLALCLRIRDEWEMPAALALLSPMTDGTLRGTTLRSKDEEDPMLSYDLLARGLDAYQFNRADWAHHPLEQNLRDLPPMLIQVGDREVLLDDSMRLAERARLFEVPVRVEIYENYWHDFQMNADLLKTAERAVERLGAFLSARMQGRQPTTEELTANAQ